MRTWAAGSSWANKVFSARLKPARVRLGGIPCSKRQLAHAAAGQSWVVAAYSGFHLMRRRLVRAHTISRHSSNRSDRDRWWPLSALRALVEFDSLEPRIDEPGVTE